MEEHVGCTSKKKHTKPVVIPITIVREGCCKIAENILELSDHANRFLDFDEGIVSRRIAYILVIHAMDEAGKLLTMMKEMVEAETTGAESIVIEGFYDHGFKGSQAGNMGLLTIDWMDSIMNDIAPIGSQDSLPFAEYRAHLERLRKGFSTERENALYVDFDGSRWVSPTTPSEEDVVFDSILLSILAAVTQATVGAGESFTQLNELVQKIAGPTTKKAFIQALRATITKWAAEHPDSGKTWKSP
jgi:AbiV family abortive infection protein